MNASRLPGVNRLKQFWRVSERRQTNLLEKKKGGGVSFGGEKSRTRAVAGAVPEAPRGPTAARA